MTGAWHPRLFSPFLGSVDYLFPCYNPSSRLTLSSEPWTVMNLHNWGSLSSLEKFQIRRHTLETWGIISCVTSGGIKDSKIITFPQGSLLERMQGGGLTCFLSSPKLHPSKPCLFSCHPLPAPTKPPHLPVQRSDGCGISGGCGEAITNGFWILDERV